MPFIAVTMLAGRTREQKHALIRELTAATVSALGVQADSVRISINVVNPDEWGAGGVPMAELRPNAPFSDPDVPA
jgi:4-oxalocrotonate tautomerase